MGTDPNEPTDDDEYLDDLLVGGGGDKTFEKNYEWDDELGEFIEKGRRYISDPSEAPEDAEVHQGERGGYFYETSGGDTTAGEAVGDDGEEPSRAPAVDPDAMRHEVEGLDSGQLEEVYAEVTGSTPPSEAPESYVVDDLVMENEPEEVANALQELGFAESAAGAEEAESGPGGDPSGEGGGQAPEGAGAEQGGALDRLDDKYVPESEFGQDAAEQIIEEYGEDGVEYVQEALHQYNDYFDMFDSVDEAVEDAELYAEM